MSEPVISVLLGDLRDLAGAGARSEIAADPQFHVCAIDVSAGRLEQALDEHQPDVAVLDGIALAHIRSMRERRPGSPSTGLVVLVESLAEAEVHGVGRLARIACLDKGMRPRAIIAAVVLTAEGLRVSAGPDRDRVASLTERERQVYLLLREGRSNAQIALALHIGIETVKTHVRGVLAKLGASSRFELRDDP